MTFCSLFHLLILALPKLQNGTYWELSEAGIATPCLEEGSMSREVISVL